MKPIARTDRLIKQVVDQDTLVYDPADDTACCLNVLASAVWQHCDGNHSVEEIARLISGEIDLPADVDPEDAVWEVLDEMRVHHLLVESTAGLFDELSATVGRRDVVRMLAALPLIPAIQGITAPITKQSTSPAPSPSITASASATRVPVSQSMTPSHSLTPSPTSSFA